MRQVFTRLLALFMLAALAAPAAAHAQAPNPNAPPPATQINENVVRELLKQKPADAVKAKTEADAMVAAAKLPCSVSESALYGPVKMQMTPVGADPKAKTPKVEVNIKLAEVACGNDLGYFITSDGTNTLYSDCLDIKRIEASISCKLAGNAQPTRQLQPLVARANSPCQVADARSYGENAKMMAYELKCASGIGQMLEVSKPRTDTSKVIATTCLAYTQNGQKFPCTLTTQEANEVPLRALAGKANPPCNVQKMRYVVGLADGSDYFEYACEGGKGLMVQASGKGEFVRSVDCMRASTIGGGCTLTDAKAGAAMMQAEYAEKLKKMGVPCDLTKIGALPTKPDAEAIEVECKGGQGGGVLMTKAGEDVFMNCGRSQAEGWLCKMTTKDQAFAQITGQLKAKGKTTCNVSNVRPLASATSAYLEVACSDGAPGYMMKYARNGAEPTDVFTCGDAKQISGGCQLPTNKAS